ncbi:hypothetical protein KI688_002065 [Linnemannia hyalina]|uniref:BZIP domain-containing protein n=1 Tax=Linnemannia hyalina TaxID=64524 RepID=A0A9P8BRA0_9FUNG|nr:hypothetical protein KI688_002065 [Linnemannia hyalina]
MSLMFKDTDLLIDEHPLEYSMIKMEPYDASHVLYDSHQRLAFTRQLQQHQDNTINNRVVLEGDHGFGMGMMGLVPSKPSQSSDSGLPPSSAQLKASTDYSRPYLSIYMMPSEPTSSSDGSSLPQSASSQSQRELIAHEAGSRDSEDGSRQQQQQQQRTVTEFGKANSSHQHAITRHAITRHAITSGANEEPPLQGPNISQLSDNNPFFTNASSPALSSTAVGLTTSSSPLSLSLSSPMTDMVESPEEIAFRRAEQNRAAQRAFRQRKQKYIKWLESKAEELDEVYRILALVRTENQQLCNLVMELDGKLSHSRSGAPKDLKRLSSPAILALGPASSTFDRDTTTAAAAASATTAFEGGATSDGLGGDPGKCSTIRGIDGSLGREISMRLMNLATFSGLGSSADQDAAMLRKLKYHPRSSNISKSSSGKSKMSLKVSQHSKRPGTALHNAFQSSTLLLQQQLQHQQKQQQQQQTDGSWINSSPISGSSPSLYSPSPPYPDARSAFGKKLSSVMFVLSVFVLFVFV